MHRHHLCKSSKRWRDSEYPLQWHHEAETASEQLQLGQDASQLCHTGLAKAPWGQWKPFESAPNNWQELQRPVREDGIYVSPTEHFYGDGSLKGQGVYARCGWAVAQLIGDVLSWVAYGPMPVLHPCQRKIKRAELWAFAHTLDKKMPPLVFNTDHQGILDGISKGRRWCCSGERPHADVWRSIWHRLDQYGLGLEGIMVQKVKAHVTMKAKRNKTAVELLHIQGNEMADFYAKAGADDDTGFGKNEALTELSDKVTAAGQMIAMAEVKAQRAADGRDTDKLDLDVQRPRKLPRLEVGPPRPHHFVRRRVRVKGKDDWSCTLCLRQTRSRAQLRRLEKQSCQGSLLARADAHPSHKVRACQGFVVCRACGVYGTVKKAALRDVCLGGRAKSSSRGAQGHWRKSRRLV